MKTAYIAFEHKHDLWEVMGNRPLWVGRDFAGNIISANPNYEECESECIDFGFLDIVAREPVKLNAWSSLMEGYN